MIVSSSYGKKPASRRPRNAGFDSLRSALNSLLKLLLVAVIAFLSVAFLCSSLKVIEKLNIPIIILH